MAYRTIMTMLQQSGLPYTLHSHPRVCTIDDAERLVPHLTHNLLKTIVFEIKDKGWVLAVVTGHDRIDYKLLARACGTNRKQIRSVAPETVERELGFEVGGIGPFPVNDSVSVMVDESLVDIGMIFCGSGRNTETVEMEMSDLIMLVDPMVSKIKKSDETFTVSEL